MVAMLPVLLILAFAGPPKAPAVQADRIVVLKSERTMTLYSHGKELRVYHVALGIGPGGPKHVQGDHETPEGNYTIDARNPHSAYIGPCTSHTRTPKTALTPVSTASLPEAT